jgi:hypothetical protein
VVTDHGPDEEITMTTMTCRQLGGPCDRELTGETADDVIKAQDRHLREAVRAGDAAHEPAHEEMKARWRHPVRSMGWYRDVKKSFAQLSAA